ncbi:MAG: hypothetical protein FWE78_05375 [Methanimicrococcus sp.]|nr:hypothetical protein [Methanimicrococcus sp.]
MKDIKNSAETKAAFKDFCFWTAGPLIIFLFLDFLSFLLTVFLALINEINFSDTDFIQGFFLPQLILVLIFSILIPYLVYKMLKPVFHYNLSFFFHGSVAFTQGVMILYIILAYATFDRNWPTSKFLWAYAVLFMFLYFVFMNLSSVIRNFKEAKKETELKDMAKLGITIISGLIFIACLLFVVSFDYQFISEYFIHDFIYFFLPPIIFLLFYKLLFKKEIIGRNFVYLPISIFIVNLINITILLSIVILFPFTVMTFTDSNIIGRVTFTIISGFFYIGILKLMSKLYQKIFCSTHDSK